MAALAKLKVKRNDLILQLQEVYDSAKKFDENEITDRQFQLRLNLLSSIQAQFDKIHEDVLNKLFEDPEALEEHQNVAKMFRKQVFEIQCHALYLTSNEETNNKTSISHNNENASKPSSKLPVLTLPKFNGSLSEWISFEQRFNALMDEHSHLKNVQKLQYLLSCLTGEALSLIKHIPIEDSQYSIAWSILKKRYFNQRIIIEHYFSQLLDAPSINNHNYEQLNLLHNIANENIQALQAMKIPISDPLILTILSRKLDKKTRHDWEIHIVNNDQPTVTDWLNFISIEVNALRINQLDGNSFSKSKHSNLKKVNTFITQPNTNCDYCKGNHPLYKCYKFKAQSEWKRNEFVKNNQICSNCLHGKHQPSSCPSNRTCMVCGEKHHSLLHPTESKPKPVKSTHMTETEITNNNQPISSLNPSSVHLSLNERKYVLMATALADIVTPNRRLTLRLLLDSASQASYITNDCVQKLCLNKIPIASTILGFGGVPVEKTEELVYVNLCPVKLEHPSYSVSAHVTKKITTTQPSIPLTGNQFSHFSNLKLSDPNFTICQPIDMLIGSDLFPYILTGNKISSDITSPVALETTFGWVIMGNISQELNTHFTTLFVQNEVSLDKSIQRFWEVETIQNNYKIQKADDAYCEKLLTREVKRTNSGRYIVPLLIPPSYPQLGNSYNNALASFNSLKRRFLIDSNLEKDYSSFMRDYLDTGHMSLASSEEADKSSGYYIPHLCVLRPESTTTKLRVVFNGSRKTDNGLSLNDILLPGPALQQNINIIINRFRLHRYVLITDIKQMYRQIQIDPQYQHFQKILWSFNPNSAPETYVLRTVTYGLSCAPFLALRTIKQLALDEGKQFPLAAEALKNDTYVDDIITGANSIEDAISLQKQLRRICHSAGLELRKWCANSSNILDGIPQEYRMISGHVLNLDNDPSTKILGLRWNPSSDNFFYQISSINSHCTKRTILSQLARIFDPQGWLTPITMFLKILMQVLWTSKIDWDDEPPEDIQLHWNSFVSQLDKLKSFVIPRMIYSNGRLDLCGFSDASERGYAAVVYCRSESTDGSISIALVMAKARVAPLARISLARLELCGALLLAQLFKVLLPTYQNRITSLTACSDSTTTLAWIRSSPHRWSTFVANRITQIREIIAPENWHYVSSQENPADPASRGLLPESFLSNNLWKTGPKWLYKPPIKWFTGEPGINPDSLTVEKRKEKSLTFVTTNEENSYINKYSSFLKLQRITAYIMRFIKSCRQGTSYASVVLYPAELQIASLAIFKMVQKNAFEHDIHLINQGKSSSKPLRQLSPFLDDDGILRVGGRLKHAAILQTQKHPVLLPQNHHVTTLIIRYEHQRHGHVGPTTLRSILLQKYWILSVRRAIRRCLSKCVICIRNAPVMLTPQMANLPTYRVQEVRPFQNVGTDFGGPFKIIQSHKRGTRSTKAYICLFICLSIRAVHLELVSDLSTEAFLSALRRFTARRGKCQMIISDCGTNYIGASRYLSEIQDFLSINQNSLSQAASQEMINWKFNPPSAPHFGGIWEAGIKSVKKHLNHIIGDHILTFEEFYTILTQIEAILNSRPLCPISDNPNEIEALTPGHFLIHGPLTALPDPDLTHIPINRLTRWKLLTQMHSHFWKRWRSDYLNSLQQKNKWLKTSSYPKINDLVIIKEDHSPPLTWKLGRIANLIPGSDGIVRVVDIRTTSGQLRRPVVKICILPINPDSNND